MRFIAGDSDPYSSFDYITARPMDLGKLALVEEILIIDLGEGRSGPVAETQRAFYHLLQRLVSGVSSFPHSSSREEGR
ncbi:hypothetical protein [Thermoflexus sp.]|uniref:hypothetical protein n=1 Tax=Thermoflexus sp. TaxID=1969742 RepID=UPI0035E4059E